MGDSNSNTLIRSFKVFDRWGGEMYSASNFEPNDQQFGWDGNYGDKKVLPGVYIYLIEVEFEEGKTELIVGDITLIR